MCPHCQDYTDSDGKCYTPGCANQRTEEAVATKRKPRARLNKTSPRKRKELRETKAIREIKPGEQCELCPRPAQETHEIAGGTGRHRSVYDRRGQLRLCRTCHTRNQSIDPADPIANKCRAMVLAVNSAKGFQRVSLESVKELL